MQTFGDLVSFNPHLHVLAADEVFLPGGRFVTLPRVPGYLLAEGFRRAVLDFLVKCEALSKGLRAQMLAWRHGGFSAHNEARVAAEDAERRKAGSRITLRPTVLMGSTNNVEVEWGHSLAAHSYFFQRPGAPMDYHLHDLTTRGGAR